MPNFQIGDRVQLKDRVYRGLPLSDGSVYSVALRLIAVKFDYEGGIREVHADQLEIVGPHPTTFPPPTLRVGDRVKVRSPLDPHDLKRGKGTILCILEAPFLMAHIQFESDPDCVWHPLQDLECLDEDLPPQELEELLRWHAETGGGCDAA